MLSRDDGVIKLEIVQSCRWVFKIELHQVHSIGECVDWHVMTLGDGDIFVSLILDSVTRIDCNWLDSGLYSVLLVKVINGDPGYLHIE